MNSHEKKNNGMSVLEILETASRRPILEIFSMPSPENDPITHCFCLDLCDDHSWDKHYGFGWCGKDEDGERIWELHHAESQLSYDLIAGILYREMEIDEGRTTEGSLADVRVEEDESKIDYGQWQDD